MEEQKETKGARWLALLLLLLLLGRGKRVLDRCTDGRTNGRIGREPNQEQPAGNRRDTHAQERKDGSLAQKRQPTPDRGWPRAQRAGDVAGEHGIARRTAVVRRRGGHMPARRRRWHAAGRMHEKDEAGPRWLDPEAKRARGRGMGTGRGDTRPHRSYGRVGVVARPSRGWMGWDGIGWDGMGFGSGEKGGWHGHGLHSWATKA
jgi:hypothetical protein